MSELHPDFRIGRVVHPLEPAAMLSICPAYHPGVSGGVVVDWDPHQPRTIGVSWIDHYGPQASVHAIHPAQLLIATPRPGRRRWLRRSAPHSVERMTSVPTLQIRNLKLYPGVIDSELSGLTFHCIADANAALREIFTAKEAFAPILRPDRTNSLPGALVVITHWPQHTDVYRIEASVTD
ncbi:hypothetical protein MHPYR_430066 [uncultured Mycobacterium sp.]|uniref:Uncharacterized protein n=1 Tax=uncultured Mycobacterium sp. TaxID=171292 RepID=A0A1Y5PFI2_9MYCO|nr:hypothetical protein MHPYR_430066 [uncultured Mycobacterium sp.]